VQRDRSSPTGPVVAGRLQPSRRGLIGGGLALGGGLLLGVSLANSRADAGSGADSAARFDAFVRIAPDSRVSLIIPAVEMGQGAYTSMAMMIAEELDVGLHRVAVEAAPADMKAYGNPLFVVQMTGGSTTTMGYYLPMRRVGASARAMLVQAAADGWGVEPYTLRTDDGVVYHDATGRAAAYGALAARAARLKPPEKPVLKDPKAFKLIGKPAKRLDTPDKVNGKALYGIDVMLPGMKFATLAASPVFGGKVARVDDRQALAVPGVRQVVVLDDMVAVVGDHMWAAKQGLDALIVEWSDGAHAHAGQADLWRALEEGSIKPGVTARKIGQAAPLEGDDVLEEVYELPFLAHAALEPMNCTVHVRQHHCEVWVGTQAMTFAVAAAAEASGLKPEQVTVHNYLIGGGFGRRLEVDGVFKAVRIAAKVEGPVKIVWTREEDIQHDYYRPLYHLRTRGRLADGRITAWRHRITGPSILARYLPVAFRDGLDSDAIEGAVNMPYGFDDLLVEYVRHDIPQAPTSFWRGVGPNANGFAVECFVDKVARRAKADPIAFRRRMLRGDPRGLAVLDLVADKSGWSAPLVNPGHGARVGRGVALLSSFGSFIACVAEVEVDPDGEVRVRRVVTATDVGAIVNPDTLEAQVQGGVIFGLSAILHGKITLANGRVEQSNFHDYRVLRIDEMPKIECHFVRNDLPPGGIGEPGTVISQPAVANAIYAATGVQLTRMPIDRARLAKGEA